jgi:hypothetical protein
VGRDDVIFAPYFSGRDGLAGEYKLLGWIQGYLWNQELYWLPGMRFRLDSNLARCRRGPQRLVGPWIGWWDT